MAYSGWVRTEQPDEQAEALLERVVAEARGDAACAGLLLTGSRAVGIGDLESDYDVSWVLFDEAHMVLVHRGRPLRERRRTADGNSLDIVITSAGELERLPAAPSWRVAGYASARVLLDKTGRISAAIDAIRLMPEEKARADAAAWFDAYLNSFYRSMKAWRRADQLGAQLHAADSAMHLVRMLFALERRWPPYHDRLRHELDTLRAENRPPGNLDEELLELVSDGGPQLQQSLAVDVIALMRARGFGHVLDGWGGEIERVLDRHFWTDSPVTDPLLQGPVRRSGGANALARDRGLRQ